MSNVTTSIQIIEYLRKKPATKKELCKVLDKEDGNMRQHLNRLRADGRVLRLGDTYFPTAEAVNPKHEMHTAKDEIAVLDELYVESKNADDLSMALGMRLSKVLHTTKALEKAGVIYCVNGIYKLC
jgi:DNA-binding transcriptional ArsR family regulator